MKKTLLLSVALILCLFNGISLAQVANHVVIAEIYGGGGNFGATYTHDYVVLYNPTGSSVDLSTWSIQRDTAISTSWTDFFPLTGSIAPNSYYLIQGRSSGTNGVPLPVAYDVSLSGFNLGNTAGKVALVNDQTAITGIGDANVVDFVGYGSTANEFEGTGPTAAPSNTSSVRRKDNSGNNTYGTNGSGWDTDNNNADFYVQASPVPLPVELSSFTASVIGSNVKLNWRTETEVNNYGFEVERYSLSAERQAWEKIGFVNGNGNSNSPKDYSYLDEDVTNGKYSYRLKQIDNDGQFEYSETIKIDLGAPKNFELSQNYPNPFNPITKIKFTLPAAGNVKLTLFNILGQEVKTLVNGFREAGAYAIDFNAGELNSGIYIYTIESGSFVQTRKMILLK